MARVDLNRRAFNKAEVGVEIGIIIGDVFRNAKSAQVDELFEPFSKLFDLVILDPDFELGIDRGCPFLDDKGGGVEIKGMANLEFIEEGDGGIRVLPRY